MDTVNFGLNAEKYVAEKLKSLGIDFWWNSHKRNYYGADFLTKYGIIDVKISNPQTKKKKNKKALRPVFWKFNWHHNGKHQNEVDIFICIINKYKLTKTLCFVIPKEVCSGKSFAVSERQINSGRYNCFLEAWDIIKDYEKRKAAIKRSVVKKESARILDYGINVKLYQACIGSGLRLQEIAKMANIEKTRFSKILNGTLQIRPNEKKALKIVLGKASETVKTKTKQLVKAFGGKAALARELQIDLSYVYKLEKGTAPGRRLFRDICNLYDQSC
ncbi:MAG: hypothetical protein U9N82_09680 [Thermodesulfobacteriota bacterium]|nr:hypothetical protein [Thermodesulfobacteriota bacterium]